MDSNLINSRNIDYNTARIQLNTASFFSNTASFYHITASLQITTKFARRPSQNHLKTLHKKQKTNPQTKGWLPIHNINPQNADPTVLHYLPGGSS